jgi:hypothetical protein
MSKLLTCTALTLMFVIGCSSTSDTPFVPKGKKIIFMETIESKATKLLVTAGSSNTASIEPMIEMLEAAKSREKPSVIQSKIMRASQPGILVGGIGKGFKEVMVGLGATETKETRMSADQFVAETTLLYCELKETPENLFLLVEAVISIRNHLSGDVVWEEDTEDKLAIVPLRDGKRMKDPSINELVNLLSSSDYDVEQAVIATMAEVGRKLGQRVRNTATKWEVAPGR